MDFNYETDITIIGAGPAGLSAAIYARRSNLNVILLDKTSPGGKVITTAHVANYPGFVEISGPDLGLKMFEQTQALNTKFLFSEALDIITSNDNQYKFVTLKNGKVIKCKAVIIATGMVNRKVGASNEVELYQKGISYCATCDGALYKDRPVAVIGSGKSAVEEAIFLSEIASHVTVISNKTKFKAEQIEIDHLNEVKNATILMQTDTLSFNGVDKLESLTLKNQINNETYDYKVDAAFIFVGFLPVAPTINSESILSKTSNFIDVDNKMSTSHLGIFAAGDIITKNIRQISTAISDGTIAALSAVEYINNSKWN